MALEGLSLKKVSITDVATKANVSVSTVSLVLRQKGNISEATINKVRAAIKELGYVHNIAAANLRSHTSNLIGLMLCDIKDMFSIKVTASIIENLEKKGFMVMMSQSSSEIQKIENCLMTFQRQGVAGVIYLSSNPFSKHLPKQILQCPFPLVVVSQSILDDHCNMVLRDNKQAAVIASRHLINTGHRSIAYIGGDFNDCIREERISGLENVLKQNGLSLKSDFLPACTSGTLAASNATRQLLENHSNISAILCHSPDVMVGCISGIFQVGRNIGKDIFLSQHVSLIGFEDILHVNLTSPSFTYVSSASKETGREAASLILRKIQNPELSYQRITLSGGLVIKDSA